MSKAQAIARLTDAFRQYGYEGATLARLSQASGLSKASLYYYFPAGKEQMAADVLDELNSALETSILEPLRGTEAPEAKLQAMAQNLQSFYQGGHQSCLLGMLALSGSRDRFQEQVRAALANWIEALAAVLREADIETETAQKRAQDAVLQVQGALILAQGLDDTSPFERVIERLPTLLLEDTGRARS